MRLLLWMVSTRLTGFSLMLFFVLFFAANNDSSFA